MRFLDVVAALAVAAVSAQAQGSVYITAGYRASSSHAGWQSVVSQGKSGGLSVDLGRYIRLGYTYEESTQKLEGYEDPDAVTTPVDENNNPKQRRIASDVYTKTHSIDLQIVLYEGSVVTPYLIGGAALRDTVTKTLVPGSSTILVSKSHDRIPQPQGGLGLQIRLNEACSFTFQYIISSGIIATPNPVAGGELEAKRTTDGSGSVGLKYKI